VKFAMSRAALDPLLFLTRLWKWTKVVLRRRGVKSAPVGRYFTILETKSGRSRRRTRLNDSDDEFSSRRRLRNFSGGENGYGDYDDDGLGSGQIGEIGLSPSGFTRVRKRNWLLLVRPTSLAVMVGFWFISLELLGLPNKPLMVATFCRHVLWVVLDFALMVWCFRLIDILAPIVDKEFSADHVYSHFMPLLRNNVRVIVIAVWALIALEQLSFPIASIMGGLGIVGLSVGLAARDFVANLFGSFVIVWDKLFREGDWIIVSGIEGEVEEIGFRTVRLRQFDNRLSVVPNSLFVSNAVDNMSDSDRVRIRLTLSLSVDTPSDLIDQFCTRTRTELVGNVSTLEATTCRVYVRDTSQDAVFVEVYVHTVAGPNTPTNETTRWGKWYSDYLEARQLVILESLRVAEALGVTIAVNRQAMVFERQRAHFQQAAAGDVASVTSTQVIP
jgi:MscS family membrane protein